jgi:hypothetical protein
MTEHDKPGRFEGKHQHGFSPDVGKVSDEVVRAGNRAFAEPSADRGPGRKVSRAERHGVTPTDTTASSALGVGVSTTSRAEEIATKKRQRGREKVGVHEKTGRPIGISKPGHGTGVGKQKTVEESPYLPPGDQAG